LVAASESFVGSTRLVIEISCSSVPYNASAEILIVLNPGSSVISKTNLTLLPSDSKGISVIISCLYWPTLIAESPVNQSSLAPSFII
jgi:hypothetical protein